MVARPPNTSGCCVNQSVTFQRDATADAIVVAKCQNVNMFTVGKSPISGVGLHPPFVLCAHPLLLHWGRGAAVRMTKR